MHLLLTLVLQWYAIPRCISCGATGCYPPPGIRKEHPVVFSCPLYFLLPSQLAPSLRACALRWLKIPKETG